MLPPCINISSYAESERSGIALLPIPQTFGYGWDVYFTPFGLSTCEPYPLDPPILWMGGYKGTKTDSRLRVSSHILTMGGRVALCSS